MAAPSPGSAPSAEGSPRPSGALARLLDAERRLDASMAEARREAEETLGDARDRARALREEAAGRLEEELASLREHVAAEHQEATAEIERRADRRARRYREVPDETVEQLARDVARRLVEATP